MRDADIVRKHKNLVYVQALKFLQTSGPAEGAEAQRPRRQAGARAGKPRKTRRRRARVDAGGRERSRARLVKEGRRRCRATDDEIREKYLERAIRELNHLTHELQDCQHCPRGNADAGARLRPSAGRRHHAQARADRGGDRGGRRLLRSRRQRADEELQAARDRSARRLRHALRQVPARRARPRRAGVRRRVAEEIAIVQPRIVVVMGEPALRVLNDLELPLAGRSSRARARSRPSPRRSTRSTCPTSTTRSTRRAPSSASGARSRPLGDWYEDLPPY